MKNLNWKVVLVILVIGGLALLFIPSIPSGFITYLYFAITMLHNQWLNDKSLRADVFD